LRAINYDLPLIQIPRSLGLVAGFCEDIQLAQHIDDVLGHSNERKVSFGQLFVAMLLNGLGFTGRTLHMYSEYFESKSFEYVLTRHTR
jgi:hypothetical protein